MVNIKLGNLKVGNISWGGLIIILIGWATFYIKRSEHSYKTHLLFVSLLFLILASFFFLQPHIEHTYNILAQGSVEKLVNSIKQWPLLAPLISILLMVLQAVIAPIPAFLITTANGLLFGLFWGTIISLIGAMAGALTSFFIARWFYKNIPSRFKHSEWLQKIEHASDHQGFKIVLIARLLPLVSFDFVSYVAGIGKMKLKTFSLATLLGMLPATVLYSAAGSSILELKNDSHSLALYSTGLALLLIVYWGGGYFRSRR